VSRWEPVMKAPQSTFPRSDIPRPVAGRTGCRKLHWPRRGKPVLTAFGIAFPARIPKPDHLPNQRHARISEPLALEPLTPCLQSDGMRLAALR